MIIGISTFITTIILLVILIICLYLVVKGKSEEIEKIFYNYTGFVYHYMMFVFMLLYVFILVLYPGINSFLSAVFMLGFKFQLQREIISPI